MTNIAIFASGNGTNAERIMDYFADSSLAQVVLVISDNPDAFVLERARRHGVESVLFSRAELADGERPLELLRQRQVGFVVLAGYLRLVPDGIVRAYEGRMVNIHPALLPAYGGKGMYGERVHRAVIEAGEKESGITIHRVNGAYDSGDILAQYRVAVEPDDTPDTLAAKIHRLEHRYFPEVIETEIGKLQIRERMRLLLISNSTTAGEPYLKYPIGRIGRFLEGVDEVAFVPYAAVTFSYDAYEAKVQARFDEIGVRVRSVHRAADPSRMIREASAICVGGGNTFALIKKMQEQGLCAAIRERIDSGIPYVGWSAGSNVTCPTICTTNDMPIVEPASFAAIGAIPFQINPHYLDAHPEGHAGETREQRILEYIEANPGVWVAGLREGCMLQLEGGVLQLTGNRPMRMFRRGVEPFEVEPGSDLNFLLG